MVRGTAMLVFSGAGSSGRVNGCMVMVLGAIVPPSVLPSIFQFPNGERRRRRLCSRALP